MNALPIAPRMNVTHIIVKQAGLGPVEAGFAQKRGDALADVQSADEALVAFFFRAVVNEQIDVGLFAVLGNGAQHRDQLLAALVLVETQAEADRKEQQGEDDQEAEGQNRTHDCPISTTVWNSDAGS